MIKVHLIEGEKGSGKSKWIHKKKEELINSGWKITESRNSTDWNTAIFVLERESQVIVLNSGSDMQSIIENFRVFLSGCKNVTEVYTSIRPREKNPKLHKWLKDALEVLGSTEEETIYLR